MRPNSSQYSGTLKDSRCTICGKQLNGMNRVEQDKHAEQCKGQTKLI